MNEEVNRPKNDETATEPEPATETEPALSAYEQDALRKKAILERVNRIQRISTIVLTVIIVLIILFVGYRKMFPAGGTTAGGTAASGESAIMAVPTAVSFNIINPW